jgi:hypothetical protein
MHDRFGALERLSPILEAVTGVGLAQGWGAFRKLRLTRCTAWRSGPSCKRGIARQRFEARP